MNKQVSIIGFGRFGKTLHRLMSDDFNLVIYSRHPLKLAPQFDKNTTVTSSLDEAYKSDTIIFAVPISEFEGVIAKHKKYFKSRHLLIDVLSVKEHPARVLKKYLKGLKTQALLTHPMFGPDSSIEGFNDLPIVLGRFSTDDKNYSYWRDYFISKGLRVIELSATQHDKMVANSHGLTHFVGRLLEEMQLQPSSIDTAGAKKLIEVKQHTCNDTWQLFNDLQHYNSYTQDMRRRLGLAYDKLYEMLLPQRVDKDLLTIGIQGGVGSFNEEAVMFWLKRSKITNFKIKYLYTSDNVLTSLHSGSIDRGIFAIHNSVGGVVGESIETMAKFKFKIIEEFAIKISHALMISKTANLDNIETIMTHPQVLAQCVATLRLKYPHLELTSGQGEMIDHAKVAKALSEGKLPKTTAVMGSKILAQIYNLTIVEDNLQDAEQNYTSFLLVSR